VDSDTTGKISLGTLYGNVNSYITSNAASANAVIDANISANVATLRGEITANGSSANSVINTRISANVATLRGEITANADSANAVIDTNISANVATLRSEITANADSANAVIDTNISANVATLRSEITANADSANSVINTRISANVATLRGEITANSLLEGGTITGDLIVSGNVTSNYAMQVVNSSMPGNGIFLLVTGASDGAYGEPSNPGYTNETVSPDGEGNRLVAEAYSTKTDGYAAFIGRRARGIASSPSAVQAGDIIVRLGGNAYGTTKFSQFADARIEFIANENITDSAKGTRIEFWTTANGTTGATNIATMNGDQVDFTGYVLAAKGFVYNPRVLVANQTAITIDYDTDSMIKANLDQNLTISHTNFVAGKIVEVWLTNTSAGQNRTITHGLSALNSTNKSTTITIASSSSMYLKFFSIDVDLANTYVSITGE
jgi:hypothetical protein